MKVLLTGGAGFLGRHIVDAAAKAGHQIFFPRSREFNLETGEGIDRYMTALQEKHGRLDAIIHSAAYYGGIGIIQSEPATVFTKNAQMGLTIFDVARRYGVKKILPIGSACAYPGYLDGDLIESKFWDGKLHDSVEAYGFSKKMLLVAQRAFYKQYKIESNHVILTNLYGPHDVFTEYRSHVVAALIKKFADARDEVTLWGDGSPIREFLYVKDAATAIVKALELPHDIEPINIGTGVGTKIKELAELVQQYTDFKGKISWDTSKPNGAVRKVLDVKRMRETLKWSPEWPLAEGLSETVSWYLANKQEADARQ